MIRNQILHLQQETEESAPLTQRKQNVSEKRNNKDRRQKRPCLDNRVSGIIVNKRKRKPSETPEPPKRQDQCFFLPFPEPPPFLLRLFGVWSSLCSRGGCAWKRVEERPDIGVALPCFPMGVSKKALQRCLMFIQPGHPTRPLSP